MSNYTHGYSGYVNHACRCDTCREGNRLAAAAARKRRASEEPPKHGTPSTYQNWRCRCEQCKAAHAKDKRERYAARKEASP